MTYFGNMPANSDGSVIWNGTSFVTSSTTSYGYNIDSERILWRWNGVDTSQFSGSFNTSASYPGTGTLEILPATTNSYVRFAAFNENILRFAVSSDFVGFWAWGFNVTLPRRYVLRFRVVNHNLGSGTRRRLGMIFGANTSTGSLHGIMHSRQVDSTTTAYSVLTNGTTGASDVAAPSIAALGSTPALLTYIVEMSGTLMTSNGPAWYITFFQTSQSSSNRAAAVDSREGATLTYGSGWATVTGSQAYIGIRNTTTASANIYFDVDMIQIEKHPSDWK